MQLTTQMFYYCLTSSQKHLFLYTMFFFRLHICACRTWCTAVYCKEIFRVRFIMIFFFGIILRFICEICSTIFVHIIFFLFVIWLFNYYLFIPLFFWKCYFILMVLYALKLNSFIMIILISWIIILFCVYKMRWWISRPFLLGWHSDLKNKIVLDFATCSHFDI